MSEDPQRKFNEPTAAQLIGYPNFDAYIDDLAGWRDDDAQRGMAAMRLAPTLAVYRAIMAGEQVPLSALDPQWRFRYRL
jgi:hypothetical protein